MVTDHLVHISNMSSGTGGCWQRTICSGERNAGRLDSGTAGEFSLSIKLNLPQYNSFIVLQIQGQQKARQDHDRVCLLAVEVRFHEAAQY